MVSSLSFSNSPEFKSKFVATLETKTADWCIDTHKLSLGLPQWLVDLDDKLRNNMSLRQSYLYRKEFFENVPVGISTARFQREVKAPFLIYVLNSTLYSFDHAQFPTTKSVIDKAIALWSRTDVGSSEWENDAECATREARAIADSVGEVAEAAWEASRLAAWSARSARLAARAAPEAAWSATWCATHANKATLTTYSVGSSATWSARSSWLSDVESVSDDFHNELIRLLKTLES